MCKLVVRGYKKSFQKLKAFYQIDIKCRTNCMKNYLTEFVITFSSFEVDRGIDTVLQTFGGLYWSSFLISLMR